jgi:anti-sigma factor RsiW
MKSFFTSPTTHEAEWTQRLQEWHDGIADAADAAAIDSHLPDCKECRDYLTALESIDAALSASLVAPALSAEFDRNLWSCIDSGNEIQRALVKRQVQDELQQNLAALEHRWRRKLTLIIPGVLTGILLAFWLVSLVSTAAWFTPLFTLAQQQLGPTTGQLVQTIATGLLGGAIGLLIAQWINPATE